MSCARLRSLHVHSSHRSATQFAYVARKGRSVRHLNVRDIRSTSVAALKQGYRQAFVGRLSPDRPRSMAVKRSSILWLAGAAVISAVAAQSACGTASNVVHVQTSATASPNSGAHRLQSLPIGQASSSLELSEQTATKSTGKKPTRSPVNITMFFPRKGEPHLLVQRRSHLLDCHTVLRPGSIVSTGIYMRLSACLRFCLGAP